MRGMPPSAVHFNGSVNLPDAETVMRAIAGKVPAGLRRIPDGETGERLGWIRYLLPTFLRTPGIEEVSATGTDYGSRAHIRLRPGTDPDAITWPDLGYASAYRESFATFRRLRDEGVVPDGVRFQMQYPTPFAPIAAWFVAQDQQRVRASYARALVADLQRLLDELPHELVAVQWDVAIEIGVLERGGSWPEVVDGLLSCVEAIPVDVPVGLHLCYGDYQHRHFVEPTSLALQVELGNAVAGAARRPVSWLSFTVPQDQRQPSYFAPLRELRPETAEELYLALVPYHPDRQEPGTTAAQVQLIDEYLGSRPWGICTECGMGRAEPQEIPVLLDLHREILADPTLRAR
jgi:hypothetical protein